LPIKKVRKCAICEKPLGDLAPPNKVYCSKQCAQKAFYSRKRQKRIQSQKKVKYTTITPAMREFRALMDEQDPFVRETLQQAIRDCVTEAVSDNIVGAGEIITGLLPKTLAGLAVDLDSSDWMIRSRAQSTVMKYAMEFKDKETKDVDLGTINVVHNVALPGTPLGRATAGEIETLEAEGDTIVEHFERDWPTCAKCNDRKHPDTMYDMEGDTWCSSCFLASTYKASQQQVALGPGDDDAS